jgi:hypothetical protein
VNAFLSIWMMLPLKKWWHQDSVLYVLHQPLYIIRHGRVIQRTYDLGEHSASSHYHKARLRASTEKGKQECVTRFTLSQFACL